MSDSNGYIDFDSLAPAEIRFKQKGEEYTLREPSEDALIRVERTKLKNARVQDGKFSAEIHDPLSAQILMLSYCVVDAAEKPVAADVIRTWGARVVRTLHEEVEKMGHFGKKETAEEVRARMEADRKKLELLEAGEDHAKNS